MYRVVHLSKTKNKKYKICSNILPTEQEKYSLEFKACGRMKVTNIASIFFSDVSLLDLF